MFESIATFTSTKDYVTCQTEALQCSYFKGQWAMPVKQGFEFYQLVNLMSLKMRESGIHDYTFNHYEQKKDSYFALSFSGPRNYDSRDIFCGGSKCTDVWNYISL